MHSKEIRQPLPISLPPLMALVAVISLSGCGATTGSVATDSMPAFNQTTQVTTQSQLPATLVIKLHTSGGFVPRLVHHHLEILSNGQVTYSNALPQAPITRTLSVARVMNLKQYMVEKRFFALKDFYTSRAADMPSTTITLYDGQRSKAVTFMGHDQTPDSLQSIDDKLQQIIDELNTPGK